MSWFTDTPLPAIVCLTDAKYAGVATDEDEGEELGEEEVDDLEAEEAEEEYLACTTGAHHARPCVCQ